MKQQKVAGVQITSMLELKQYCIPLALPETYDTLRLLNVVTPVRPAHARIDTARDVEASDDEAPEFGGAAVGGGAGPSGLAPPVPPRPEPVPRTPGVGQVVPSTARLLHVPIDALAFGVEGAVFTGRMQLHWLSQLVNMPHQFVLHMDGKHKLHHGGWLLTSLGTHHLRWDTHNLTLSTQFVPLVYMMSKQIESNGSALMLTKSLKAVAEQYFPDAPLLPGAAMADHCDAFRNAYGHVFTEAAFGTCQPTLTPSSHPSLPSHHVLPSQARATPTSCASGRRASTPRRSGSTLTRSRCICATSTWRTRRRCATSS